MEKLSGNAAESGNGICPAVRSAAAFADQRRQPLGMESGPVAVGKGGELRCGPMKKSCNTPFGSKHPTPERRSILFHSLADLTVKDDNKIMTKNRQYSRRFPVLYCRLFRYLHRIIISVLLEIIPRHIPCDKLPDWCPAAVRRRSGDAIPSQLTRHAVVDVVRSGGQP